MKGFRYAAAMFLAMVLMLAMPLAVFGEAHIDEHGNIIQENVPLEGGIITLGAELDLGEDYDHDFRPVDLGFGSFSGLVVESEREGFLSVRNLDGAIVNFRIGYQTYFAHGKPEVGDNVIGFFDMNMPAPMIFPPQFLATAIVVSNDEPPFFLVARFGAGMESLDGKYLLNIGGDTEIFMQDGQEVVYADGVLTVEYTYEDEEGEEAVSVITIDTARKMLVEYTISYRDIDPTTIVPERITILYEDIVALDGFYPEPVHLGFGSFSGQVIETELEGFVAVQNADGETVNFRIDVQTFFAPGKPEVGDYVIGFYDLNMPVPAIFPPQYLAAAIVIVEEAPPFFVVARFGLDFHSLDGRYRLIIGEDTEIFMQDGRVVSFEDGVLTAYYTYEDEDGEEAVSVITIDTARKMLVEYTISYRDIDPTTIVPERITILYEGITALDGFVPEPVLLGFGSFSGQVVETELDGFVAVQNADGEIVNFRIGVQTFFAPGEPEVGDNVVGFYDLNMPTVLPYPPQYLAAAIVITDDEPPFFMVARFGLDLYSLDGRYRLIIGEDTEIFMPDGRVVNYEDGVLTVDYTYEDEDGEEVVSVITIDTARKMLVEYTISYRDIDPTTIVPERITVLYEDITPLYGLYFEPVDLGFGSFAGQVVESELEGILSVHNLDGSILNFRIGHQTLLTPREPEVGDHVIGFFDMNMPAPMIFPPQFTATAIVIAEEAPPFFVVARFGLDFYSLDGRFRLIIGEETEIFMQDGKEVNFEDGVLTVDYTYTDEDGQEVVIIITIDTARKMLVEYTISNRDINPTTLHPDRITILFEIAVHLPGFVEGNGFMGAVTLPYELDEDELPPLPDDMD